MIYGDSAEAYDFSNERGTEGRDRIELKRQNSQIELGHQHQLKAVCRARISVNLTSSLLEVIVERQINTVLMFFHCLV